QASRPEQPRPAICPPGGDGAGRCADRPGTGRDDRDLAASLHSSDLPLPAPVLLDDDGDADATAVIDSEESEEDALARAMAEERAAQEMDA
ncbi:hypothetical protein ACPA1U_25370, partial [Ectopseudomonas hydrolytica]